MSAANALLGSNTKENKDGFEICTIQVNMKRAKYYFILDSKFTLVTGDSFTGKTHFCKAIRSGNSEYISCNYNIVYIDNIYKLEKLTCTDLAVIDLDFLYYDDNGVMQKIIQKSKCLILIISRQDSLCSVSYSVDDIKHVISSKGVGMLENVYPTELYRNNIGNAHYCFIEDEKSGYTFFKNFYPYIESTKGKENYKHIFKKSENTIFIFDRCGFGSQIADFYNQYRQNRIDVLDYDSFEKFLLEITTGSTELAPMVSNKEEYYFKQLKQILTQYSKDEDCSCVNGCFNSHCYDCRFRNQILHVEKLIRDSKYNTYL